MLVLQRLVRGTYKLFPKEYVKPEAVAANDDGEVHRMFEYIMASVTRSECQQRAQHATNTMMYCYAMLHASAIMVRSAEAETNITSDLALVSISKFSFHHPFLSREIFHIGAKSQNAGTDDR